MPREVERYELRDGLLHAVTRDDMESSLHSVAPITFNGEVIGTGYGNYGALVNVEAVGGDARIQAILVEAFAATVHAARVEREAHRRAMKAEAEQREATRLARALRALGLG